MNTSELKLNIFRQVDKMDKRKLEEIHGLLVNYINGQQDISDWDILSENQKKGIYKAIDELNAGHYIAHEDVMKKYKSKYSND